MDLSRNGVDRVFGVAVCILHKSTVNWGCGRYQAGKKRVGMGKIKHEHTQLRNSTKLQFFVETL